MVWLMLISELGSKLGLWLRVWVAQLCAIIVSLVDRSLFCQSALKIWLVFSGVYWSVLSRRFIFSSSNWCWLSTNWSRFFSSSSRATVSYMFCLKLLFSLDFHYGKWFFSEGSIGVFNFSLFLALPLLVACEKLTKKNIRRKKKDKLFTLVDLNMAGKLLRLG